MTGIPITELLHINLDKQLDIPLFRQLYQQIREDILAGRFRSGMKLPASRSLAQQLAVSRNTVTSAIEQLMAEGYLVSKMGAGTFVASDLPEKFHQAPSSQMLAETMPCKQKTLSTLAATLNKMTIHTNVASRAFTVGLPALDEFPVKVWQQISQQHAGSKKLGFHDVQGLQSLREAICDYVVSSRAVKCKPEQILVTSGAQQALDLIVRVLVDAGDNVVIEDPAYINARVVLQAAKANIHAFAVDEKGLPPDCLNLVQNPKIAYLTPTHQYPLGMIMPLNRRLKWLQKAAEAGCWLIEDDYDSEYHYGTRPLAALQGLDPYGQVIYVGSFSKVLFPSLRLGYLVLPEKLIDVFRKAKRMMVGQSNVMSQAITADFILAGHFSRHIRKMRQSYEYKLTTFLQICQQNLPSHFSLATNHGGLHTVIELLNQQDDQKLVAKLHQQGMNGNALSDYYMNPCKKSGLVLGYAGVNKNELTQQIQKLCKILKTS